MFEKIEINSKRWFDLTPLLNEEFRNIDGYEGLYQISNYGRIKSGLRYVKLGNNNKKIPEKILKMSFNVYGYCHTTISNKNKRKLVYSHIEVGKKFLPNVDNKPTINHKDGNKKNNCVDNLEWATYSEQLYHAYNNNLRIKPFGEINTMYGKSGKKHHRSKPILQYDLHGNFIKEWENAYEIKRQLGIAQGNINQCCLGKRKKAHNYIWKYKKIEGK